VVRATAGLGPWHSTSRAPVAIAERSGRVGEQREFELDGVLATETLTGLSDHHHHLHYTVRHANAVPEDCDAKVELHPVTMDGTTLVVWTLDGANTGFSPDLALHQAALKRALQTTRGKLVEVTS